MKNNPDYESKWSKRVYPDDLASQQEALRDDAHLKAFKAYRDSVKNDPYIPAYHFYAPDGYINDPNGLCRWGDKWHLFYQAYPPVDPRQHWGHAVSDDLVHWRDLPTAIYPNPERCVFSGSSLAEEDRVIAIYHGLEIGTMIATASDPLLLNWTKHENDPVIPHLPDDQRDKNGRPYRVFDPFIWKEDEGYYALSGSYYGPDWMFGGKDNPREKSRMVEHLFFSQDLARWTYVGELLDEQVFMPEGNDGACPYFWPIGDKHMLLWFSHSTGPHCLLGTYNKTIHKFHPEKHLALSFGPVGCGSLHAPCATPDGDGGLFVIYNTTDCTRFMPIEGKPVRQGGMSVMRHMRLDESGEIVIEPVEGLTSLREAQLAREAFILEANSERVLAARGKQLDIEIELSDIEASCVAINVLRSGDAAERTGIHYYKREMRFGDRYFGREGYLTVDTTYSSQLAGLNGRIPETTPLPLQTEPNAPLKLRILVDKCVIEVFANGRAVLQMAYPTLSDSDGISIEARGGSVKVGALNVWSMGGIF